MVRYLSHRLCHLVNVFCYISCTSCGCRAWVSHTAKGLHDCMLAQPNAPSLPP